MLTFLFWNTHGKQVSRLVADLAKEHSVDVLILAESEMRDADLLEQLNMPSTDELYHLPLSFCEPIRVFTRFSAEFTVPMEESRHYSFRRMILPAREPIVLGIAHLSSKLFQSEDSQVLECTRLSRIIAEQEDLEGHSRTLLVGDFNMNPFEKGLVGAAGLHALMRRDVALRRARTVQDVDYPL